MQTNDFRITVWSAEILPTKDSSNPWDWDGDIPDWVIDVCYDISTVYPNAGTFAEVLQVVDEVGPVLLEGTVPPDPYLWFIVMDDSNIYEYGESDYVSDSVTPSWNVWVDVEVFPGELFCADVWDSDLVSDDEIGWACFTLEELQALAPYKDYVLPLSHEYLGGQLWGVQVTIEAR